MAEPASLDTLTAEDFSPHTGASFALDLSDRESVALTLREVTQVGAGGQAPRQPFALLFTGPKSPALPQQIYPLQHEALGALDIFLVPVRETASQREYEAIFA